MYRQIGPTCDVTSLQGPHEEEPLVAVRLVVVSPAPRVHCQNAISSHVPPDTLGTSGGGGGLELLEHFDFSHIGMRQKSKPMGVTRNWGFTLAFQSFENLHC